MMSVVVILVVFGALGAVIAALVGVIDRGERKKSKHKPKPQWKVSVERVSTSNDYDWRDARLQGQVAVCLRKGGKERLSVYVLDVADEAFEDKLIKAKLQAEERAHMLNAGS